MIVVGAFNVRKRWAYVPGVERADSHSFAVPVCVVGHYVRVIVIVPNVKGLAGLAQFPTAGLPGNPSASLVCIQSTGKSKNITDSWKMSPGGPSDDEEDGDDRLRLRRTCP